MDQVNVWKTAFKKFEEIWFSTNFTWSILEYFVPYEEWNGYVRRVFWLRYSLSAGLSKILILFTCVLRMPLPGFHFASNSNIIRFFIE